MKCHLCQVDLEPRMHSQPTRGPLGGVRYERSYCDACTRKHQWTGGSKDALTRLGTGETDAAELARINLTHPSPMKGRRA